MRFQPKRRASTDHKPGPNIARPPPMVASKSGDHGSPARVRTCPNASKATSVPAIGVHRPGIRRIPDPARNAEVIVVCVGGLLHRVELARTTSAEPPIRRMRSKPMPGQPLANVEYNRRTGTLLHLTYSDVRKAERSPKKSCDLHSLGVCYESCRPARSLVGATAR